MIHDKAQCTGYRPRQSCKHTDVEHSLALRLQIFHMHICKHIVDLGRLVDEWCIAALWYWPAQEGTQRRPPLADVILEQPVCRHKGSHARIVRFEARFATAWKVMIIEYLVEFLEHRPVPSVRHAEKPSEEANGGPDDAIVDDFKGSGNGSECSFEDYFCIWVHLNKFLRKQDIKILAAWYSANAVVFRFQPI
ncbi:hypothetical protein MY1884_003464 [Beauveria asiatica]